MSWASWQAFVDMGGHGRFVWGSFGVVALGLLIEWVRLQHEDAQRRADMRQRWLEEGADDLGAAFHKGVRP